ncbi:MAG TPA: orotidine-5'-phosphate decarboxylase [Candidatus Krumholzibacteria bacterium]|nr:orotidine-5'-phosphate decarboxylase [Candidatus Krumholzibacteria bacterium]
MDRSRLIAQLRAVPVRRRVITALDVPTGREAVSLAGSLGRGDHFVKVGLEVFSAAGPAVVEYLQGMHRRVFLDLKYHDIPNTVASAARVAAELGVAMCTVHAAAGRAAMAAAAEGLAKASGSGPRPALLAVTILTSMSEEDLAETAPSPDSLSDRIDRLARLAWDAGCDGLVCSAADLPRLRAAVGPDPLVVTPGIRPAGAAVNDQHRIATPRAALDAGADFLVVGRPITRAADPAAALAAIADELAPAKGHDR